MTRIIIHKGRCVVLCVSFNGYDWMACDDATYDGPGCPLGLGKDMESAINDWRDQT